VAGVLAAVLGIRVEELIYHLDRRATLLARQRTLACSAAAGVLALSTLWSFRESFHRGALQDDGYAGGMGRDVERFLAQFRVEGGAIPPDTLQPTSALPPPGPEPLSVVEAVPAPVAEPEPAPMMGMAGEPEAVKLAVKAWLDRAESHLPAEPDQAREWLVQCEKLLTGASPGEFGNELYRFHALLAVAARCHGDSDTAKSELATAIEFWTQMPVQDPGTREAEAFEILATISPGADWMGSVRILVEWLAQQSAPADRLLKRALRLQELAADRPSLIPLVDAFLAKAVERMAPAPADGVAERARWDLMRAEFASTTGREERGSAILTAALLSLERDGRTEAGLHRALKAQIVFHLH
jgi:hypothetical protein